MTEANLQQLEQRNAELEKTIEELKGAIAQKDTKVEEIAGELERLQGHMIQMEKMAMLGQMVSGISHDINNPINFIYGNLPYVEEHIDDLFRVLEVYQSVCPDNSEEIEDILDEVELDYVLDDLPRIVNSMKVGADRIRSLVLTLRNFYRLDEPQMKAANLEEGIDNTLVLLNNRYKQNITVVKEFEELPEVECYINQLNQVFMNLLSNAIDVLLDESSQEEATEDRPKKKREIAIVTKRLDESSVSIAITDNGAGIPSELEERIFEPFFTTKPMGVGTGLGLSISRQIIEQTHHGRLYCHSTPGEGSTFTIELPISQPQAG
jgi:signal transduction histidine kinase